MIDFINIAGYKSIKNYNIPIRPINILIGANGSGKSNFVSFFEFLNFMSNRKLKEYVGMRGGEDKLLYNGSKHTQEISFELSFDNAKNGYKATLKLGDAGFIVQNEYLVYMNNNGRNIASYGPEANIKSTDNYRAKYVIGFLNSLRKYHFHDTSKNSPFTNVSQKDIDSLYLYEDGRNLAAFLYSVHEAHKIVYNRIIKTIQSIAPYFSDFFFQPDVNGGIRLLWQDKFSDTIYGANNFSDGTMRFIALATLFLQPYLPSTIIIDEPELGLHPFAITKLAGMIKSVASRGSQVIIATQSADLVNHFDAEDIIVVDHIHGETHFRRLESSVLAEWLDDYSIGELWQRNMIQGGQPK